MSQPKINFIYLLFGASLFLTLFLSNAGGREGTWASAPGDSGSCGLCHNSAGTGSVALSGAPTAYVEGQTYNMTLTITDAGASVGGFQIVATNGTNNTQIGTFNPGSGQRLNGVNRLVQSTPLAFSGGSVSWPISWTAPASGGPANVQFYFAGNAANGDTNNGAGDNAYVGTTGLIPLPVELANFTAYASSDQEVTLHWITASERNTSHFEIERSDDGLDYELLDKLEAAGESVSDEFYEFIDPRPKLQTDMYYRLKMVDLDGQFEYSPVKTLFIEDRRADVFQIAPNPIQVGQDLRLTLKERTTELPVIWSLYTLNGQLIQQQLLSNNNQRVLLSTRNLSPGLYLISLTNHAGVLETKKLVVR